METNGGRSTVKFRSNNAINFKETMARTARCCDSHFAETCLYLLAFKINPLKKEIEIRKQTKNKTNEQRKSMLFIGSFIGTGF